MGALSYADTDFKMYVEKKTSKKITFENLETNIVLNDEELRNVSSNAQEEH